MFIPQTGQIKSSRLNILDKSYYNMSPKHKFLYIDMLYTLYINTSLQTLVYWQIIY